MCAIGDLQRLRGRRRRSRMRLHIARCTPHAQAPSRTAWGRRPLRHPRWAPPTPEAGAPQPAHPFLRQHFALPRCSSPSSTILDLRGRPRSSPSSVALYCRVWSSFQNPNTPAALQCLLGGKLVRRQGSQARAVGDAMRAPVGYALALKMPVAHGIDLVTVDVSRPLASRSGGDAGWRWRSSPTPPVEQRWWISPTPPMPAREAEVCPRLACPGCSLGRLGTGPPSSPAAASSATTTLLSSTGSMRFFLLYLLPRAGGRPGLL